MSRYRTPLLVPTDKPFTDYLIRLSKPAKKNYKKAEKINSGKEFKLIPYDNDLVIQFMKLWEDQLVFGKHPVWTVGIDYFQDRAEQGRLISFGAIQDAAIYGLQMLEIYGDYAYAPTPMYGKEWNKDYLPTWMWFNSIKHLCDNTRVRFLDVGGAFNGTWRNLITIRDRPDLHHLQYKWRYVPMDIKENPDKQLEYEAFDCDCLAKQLVIGRPGCKYCE